MLKNYIKTAWRHLTKNKIYSAINITGLGIGLAVCILIILYVQHESSYNSFHANASRIYLAQTKLKVANDSILIPFLSYSAAPKLKETEPYVKDYCRLIKEDRNTVIQNPESPSLKSGEQGFIFADKNFFTFFSFKLQEGNKQQVLENPFRSLFHAKLRKNISVKNHL